MDVICRLNKEQKLTFVLVTHDPKIAERTDRVLVMGDGVIIKEYVPAHW